MESSDKKEEELKIKIFMIFHNLEKQYMISFASPLEKADGAIDSVNPFRNVILLDL